MKWKKKWENETTKNKKNKAEKKFLHTSHMLWTAQIEIQPNKKYDYDIPYCDVINKTASVEVSKKKYQIKYECEYVHDKKKYYFYLISLQVLQVSLHTTFQIQKNPLCSCQNNRKPSYFGLKTYKKILNLENIHE